LLPNHIKFSRKSELDNNKGFSFIVSLVTDLEVEVEVANFSRTKSGNLMLVDSDGFCYLINRKRDKRIYWVCQRREKCKVTAISDAEFIIKRGRPSDHTHSPYPPPANRFNAQPETDDISS
jgi:hypothetical protein